MDGVDEKSEHRFKKSSLGRQLCEVRGGGGGRGEKCIVESKWGLQKVEIDVGEKNLSLKNGGTSPAASAWARRSATHPEHSSLRC